MKNIQVCLAVCLTALLVLSGCQKQPVAEPEPEVDYESMVKDPVDVSIADCLTEQQVTEVVGYPMTLNGLFEEGTQAVYTNEDSSCQVQVNLRNETRSAFDEYVAELSTTSQEGLGEAAYWSTDTGELLVYQNGYFLGVWVQLPDGGTPNGCIRRIAEQILSQL